jgi:transcriptional regulator with XRE-family HTH domain
LATETDRKRRPRGIKSGVVQRRELGDFLRVRRAALAPHQVGLPSAKNGTRRVAGLRRQEVAALAGVSTAYYVKIEQGRVGTVSDEILCALENALCLDKLERLHLRSLVKYANRTDVIAPAKIKARPALKAMIDAMDRVPAIIHGPCLDVLATNRMAKLLLDDFEQMRPADRNLARWLFFNPRAKLVFPDWRTMLPQVAAMLRRRTTEGPEDPLLQQLVHEMITASTEFRSYWDDYRLYEHSFGVKRIFNDRVGELTLCYETLVLPRDEGQTIVVYTADRGSPSEEKLRLLESWDDPPGRGGLAVDR